MAFRVVNISKEELDKKIKKLYSDIRNGVYFGDISEEDEAFLIVEKFFREVLESV